MSMTFPGMPSSQYLSVFTNPKISKLFCLGVLVEVSLCVLSHFSHVRFFMTLWTVASQVPLSMEFSGQEYWSGLPFPPPGNLPNPGIEPTSLMSPALTGRFFTTCSTWGIPCHNHQHVNENVVSGSAYLDNNTEELFGIVGSIFT